MEQQVENNDELLKKKEYLLKRKDEQLEDKPEYCRKIAEIQGDKCNNQQ